VKRKNATYRSCETAYAAFLEPARWNKNFPPRCRGALSADHEQQTQAVYRFIADARLA
jgi:hypothetical protein